MTRATITTLLFPAILLCLEGVTASLPRITYAAKTTKVTNCLSDQTATIREQINSEIRELLSNVIDTGGNSSNNDSSGVPLLPCDVLDTSTLGNCPENPADSCQHLSDQRPDARSGDYWIQASTTAPELIFCNMEHSACNTTRGWSQVVNLTVDRDTTECPGEFELFTSPGAYGCGRPKNTQSSCVSAFFPVHGVQYTQVTGRVFGYFNVTGDTRGETFESSIDDPYIFGVSITNSLPRHHIWSFISNVDILSITSRSLAITRNDFFCEGDNIYQAYDYDYYEHDSNYSINEYFGSSDTLWDGEGCGDLNCCTRAPWFCQQLNEPTTSDIEVRICGYSNQQTSHQDTPLTLIELYVQ